MAQVFKWIRPGYELVKVKLEWNVEVPFLKTRDEDGGQLFSKGISRQETAGSQWILSLQDEGKQMSIRAWHFDSAGTQVKLSDPVLVKFAIVNGKGQKVLQQLVPSQPNVSWVQILLSKWEIDCSEYLQSDGSLTFYCKIISHARKKHVANPGTIESYCKSQLIGHLEKLFDSMKLSDVTFSIQDHEFPAHKVILVTRSKVFASMFEYPTKENLTNEIEIEDIEPEVFHELLRFIYTGQVSLDKMQTIAASLMIAADKYLVDGLKDMCENYFLRYISPENCVVLLLNGDLQNPTENLKEAAKFFLLYPSQVMATDNWETAKVENPALLCDIQEFVFSCK